MPMAAQCRHCGHEGATVMFCHPETITMYPLCEACRAKLYTALNKFLNIQEEPKTNKKAA